MFYVYVLESGAHRYIGSTVDLKRRLAEHNAGQNQSTKAYAPWSIVYYEAHTNAEDAKRRERYFKTTPGRQSLSRMLRQYYAAKSRPSPDFGDQRSTSGKKPAAKKATDKK